MGVAVAKKRTSHRLELLARIQTTRDVESLNVLLRRIRNGAPSGCFTKEWGKVLTGVMLEQLGPDWIKRIEVEKPHPIRRLEIVRRCKRELDYDNLVGGAKPLIDALKSQPILYNGTKVGRLAGWFYDDHPKYVKVYYMQIPTGETPWLEISLYGRTG